MSSCFDVVALTAPVKAVATAVSWWSPADVAVPRDTLLPPRCTSAHTSPGPWSAQSVQWCTLSPNGSAATSSGTSSWTRTASTAAAPRARHVGDRRRAHLYRALDDRAPVDDEVAAEGAARPAAFVAPTLIHTPWVSAVGSRTGTDAFTCAQRRPPARPAARTRSYRRRRAPRRVAGVDAANLASLRGRRFRHEGRRRRWRGRPERGRRRDRTAAAKARPTAAGARGGRAE